MITTMMTIASTSYNCSRQQSSAGITNVNQQWFFREEGLREISRTLYLIDFLTHLNSMRKSKGWVEETLTRCNFYHFISLLHITLSLHISTARNFTDIV